MMEVEEKNEQQSSQFPNSSYSNSNAQRMRGFDENKMDSEQIGRGMNANSETGEDHAQILSGI